MVMLETVEIPEKTGKQQKYTILLRQIRELLHDEDNLIASLSNVASVLHHGMNFTWTGFYFVQGNELVLGPFQGVAARMRIPKGEGICGMAYAEERSMLIEDVEQFAGYIPCGEHDRSEMALPAFSKGEIALVLNVNSSKLKNFTETDHKYLTEVIHLIEEIL